MAEKPTKAELAKLPGGEHFDVDNATTEDFDKHFEILERRSKLAALTPAVTAAPLAVAAAVQAPAAPFTPAPGDIRAVNAEGQVRYFTPETLAILGDTAAGWERSVEKPELL